MTSQTIPADYGQLQRGIFDPCLVEDCAKAFASATELGAIRPWLCLLQHLRTGWPAQIFMSENLY